MYRMDPESISARKPHVRYDELMLEPGDGRGDQPSLLARESWTQRAPKKGPPAFGGPCCMPWS